MRLSLRVVGVSLIVLMISACNLNTSPRTEESPTPADDFGYRVPSPTNGDSFVLTTPTDTLPTLNFSTVDLSTLTPRPTLFIPSPFPTLIVPTAISAQSGLPPRPTMRPAPPRPEVTTPNIPLIPDSAFVNSPAGVSFDLGAFIVSQPGKIGTWQESVSKRQFTATESIQFVSMNMSINPRLLLALAEYQGGWLSNPAPDGDAANYPFGKVEDTRKGLFLQAIWAGNQLNQAYYDWKQRGVTRVTLPGGEKISFEPDLPAGTIALQTYFAALSPDRATWERHIGESGFIQTYRALFGDPFAGGYDPVVPYPLQQPVMQLPFVRGELWYFTSGPHGAWGRLTSGWSALDFAPPTPPETVIREQGRCYVSPYFVTAVADGVIARSGDGAVVLDLDMDGDERTGWTVIYLHIARQDRIARGTRIAAGSPIGRPSCEGFYLNSQGTHVHIARRYNGEWIAADCQLCRYDVDNPPLQFGDWVAHGVPRRANEGYLQNGSQIRKLHNRRDSEINGLIW